jgi:hypothetical protein
MNRPRKRVEAHFAPETRFAVVPVAAAPFRGTLETELERLKERLLRQSLAETADADGHALLRRASNEAAALAWTTAFPTLVLPELFREKAGAALRHVRKQAALLKRRVMAVNGEAA